MWVLLLCCGRGIEVGALLFVAVVVGAIGVDCVLVGGGVEGFLGWAWAGDEDGLECFSSDFL